MYKDYRKTLPLFILLIALTGRVHAQTLLDKQISVDIKNQQLDQALEIISNTAGFYFSYNSNILKKDSIVSVSAQNSSIKNILGQLFGNQFEFRESGNYHFGALKGKLFGYGLSYSGGAAGYNGYFPVQAFLCGHKHAFLYHFFRKRLVLGNGFGHRKVEGLFSNLDLPD